MVVAGPNLPASPTPILDRITPFPPPKRSPDPQLVVGFFLGFGVTTFVLLLAFGDSLGPWFTERFAHVFLWLRDSGEFGLLALYFLLGILLAIALHEAAHVLVGAGLGFTCNSLRIGPLQFDRPFRISLVRGESKAASGWAVMIPVSTNALVPRMVTMVFAGPATNLLTGFAVLFMRSSKGPLSSGIAYSSLFMGLLNLLPLQAAWEITDGKRILRLLMRPEYAERLVALVKLGGEVNAGVPYEDLTSDFLAHAIAIQDDSPDTVAAYWLAGAAAYFQKDDAKAATYLETCLRHSRFVPPYVQHALMCDAGVFQARRQKRVDLAEQWLAAIPGKTAIPWLRAEVEAAISEAKGDIEGALRQLDAIEKVILAAPEQAHRERAHRDLLRWKSELLFQVAARLQKGEP